MTKAVLRDRTAGSTENAGYGTKSHGKQDLMERPQTLHSCPKRVHPHPQPLGKAGHPKVLTLASNAATVNHLLSAAETSQHSGWGDTGISSRGSMASKEREAHNS
ncbi:hypothetical protein E2C01_072739 [Portunus trituberculatus]|uniref:Uncharacterized protein n=1 Tax=Portunus trituberculatus TaxID=210409 RepID=A0A5B7IC69_PORTR|nr:hypothetical protein [Portunus trituberculatus]